MLPAALQALFVAVFALMCSRRHTAVVVVAAVVVAVVAVVVAVATTFPCPCADLPAHGYVAFLPSNAAAAQAASGTQAESEVNLFRNSPSNQIDRTRPRSC
eukprot:TRINITY_DN18786_c0_g1_i1.p1 TRINITY_DN18786_c0_g1~~TRINITY_DN18786_c0_g1_i1.p1  ORF type:complete len:101 (+),score=26.37 TRINITY_DN18786_c0_g1_i1:114-416(+)